MIDWRGWSAVVAASITAVLAAIAASIPIASECSTLPEVDWWPAVPLFVLFVLTGALVFISGSTAQRFTLFFAIAVVMAGYVAGLALTLPSVFETEISCASRGYR
jgi:hypothetical protein